MLTKVTIGELNAHLALRAMDEWEFASQHFIGERAPREMVHGVAPLYLAHIGALN